MSLRQPVRDPLSANMRRDLRRLAYAPRGPEPRGSPRHKELVPTCESRAQPIRLFNPGDQRPQRRRKRCESAYGPIDMKPKLLFLGYFGYVFKRIDSSCVHCAGRGHDHEWQKPAGAVLFNRLFQSGNVHAAGTVNPDLAQVGGIRDPRVPSLERCSRALPRRYRLSIGQQTDRGPARERPARTL